MAKKILYKITAYHCPRCGGVTEPTKKYCDYCERELKLEKFTKDNRSLKVRLLVDCCRDYVNFNEITSIDSVPNEPQYIDCTLLDDYKVTRIKEVEYEPTMDLYMPFTFRGRELASLISTNEIYKMRIEYQGCNGFAGAFDIKGSLDNVMAEMRQYSLGYQKISINPIEFNRSDDLIPKDVLKEFRCPNCGAPIKSQYGACDWCGGWSAVEW